MLNTQHYLGYYFLWYHRKTFSITSLDLYFKYIPNEGKHDGGSFQIYQSPPANPYLGVGVKPL